MSFRIFPISDEHITGFRAALDSVAREQRYLGLVEAPALPQVEQFVRNNIANGDAQYVAVVDGQVVGWCDAIPEWAASMQHRAKVGMGIVAAHRGKGIGRALMQHTLEHAAQKGVLRFDLEVRADNTPAIALYEKMGFVHEGRKPAGLFQQGAFHDVLCMGKVLSTD